MPESLEVSDAVAAHPARIYRTWLDSQGHSDMTGGGAVCSDEVGDEFSAWDGYITGKNLELDPPDRIIQSWRTAEFSDNDPDSRLEVQLDPIPGGTQVTIRHTNIPDGQTQYEQGWIDNYLEPMKEYFGAVD